MNLKIKLLLLIFDKSEKQNVQRYAVSCTLEKFKNKDMQTLNNSTKITARKLHKYIDNFLQLTWNTTLIYSLSV